MNFSTKSLASFILTLLLSHGVVAQDVAPVYDLVIYGDSSSAVTAAIAAKRQGRSVILVNPTHFVGGISASGLGASDFLGKRGTFGGIASEFYNAIAAAYGVTGEALDEVIEALITEHQAVLLAAEGIA